MAINRITGPNSTPLAVSDYQAQNNLIAALGNGINTVPFSGSSMTIGAVLQVGGTLYRVDTATSITGTASPYVKITPSGATASASFVANLTGVTWNNAYNGYYDVGGNLYVFDEYSAYLSGQITTLNGLSAQIGGRHGKRVWGTPGTYTWVCPPFVHEILFNGVGAGGNGANGVQNSYGGGGGGSGASIVDTNIAVVPGTTYNITISNSAASTFVGGSINISLGKGGDASGSTAGSGGVGSGGASNGFAGGPGLTSGSSSHGGGGGGIGGAGSGSASIAYAGAGGGSGGAASVLSGGKGRAATIFNGAGSSGVVLTNVPSQSAGPGGGGGCSAGATVQTYSSGNGGAGGGGAGGTGTGSNTGAGLGGPAMIVIEW